MSDRYYAVHLLGKLKDARAVPTLIPLLGDADLNYKVAWALAEIGDSSAVGPLIAALDDAGSRDAGATEAVPQLRGLLNDQETTRLGHPVTVAEVARAVIRGLGAVP
jgi:HEAT repeat protein